jgi:hypothetical protein
VHGASTHTATGSFSSSLVDPHAPQTCYRAPHAIRPLSGTARNDGQRPLRSRVHVRRLRSARVVSRPRTGVREPAHEDESVVGDASGVIDACDITRGDPARSTPRSEGDRSRAGTTPRTVENDRGSSAARASRAPRICSYFCRSTQFGSASARARRAEGKNSTVASILHHFPHLTSEPTRDLTTRWTFHLRVL